MTDRTATLRRSLKEAGLRVTEPRIAVLEWLDEHPHATVDQIGHGVRGARIPTVSTQAIYDVLDACTQAGLVRRIRPADHPARYERQTHDNHHHVVCRSCGLIEDVACQGDGPPCLAPDDTHGYVLDEAEVTFWGLCQSCLDRQERKPTP